MMARVIQRRFVSPKLFHKFRPLLVEEQMVILEGDVSIDDFSNKPRITVREVYTIDQARSRFAKSLQINLAAKQLPDANLLSRLFKNHLGGNCSVVLRVQDDTTTTHIKLGAKWLVKPSDALLALIQEQLATEEVVFGY